MDPNAMPIDHLESNPLACYDQESPGLSSLTPSSSASASTLSDSDSTSTITDSTQCPKPSYPLPNLQDALARSFTQKILRGGSGSGLTPEDMENVRRCISLDRMFIDNIQGVGLFASGLKKSKLSDEALQEAVLMKQAGRETRRLRALAATWEIKEAKHYQKLLRHLLRSHEDDLRTFDTFFSDIKSSNDLIEFKHELYSEELASMVTSDLQLNTLEAEAEARPSHNKSKGKSKVAP